MSFRRLARPSLRLGAAALAAVTLAACGSSGGDAGDDGRISVVATTNVYGDIAATIGGDAVDVTSIISDPSRDPHSYEADAKTQLTLRDADLVIENGGGYDDFADTMLDAAGSDAVVLNVVDLSGLDEGGEFNEHVWYSLPTVITLVDRLVQELSSLDGDAASTFEANGDQLKEKIRGLEDRADAIAATSGGANVLVTEPVPLYLLEACGLTNVTPEAFSEAIEEETDVAPRDLQEMLSIIAGGGVRILAFNEQTSGPASEQVVKAAREAGITVIPVRETLPDGEGYVAWMAGYLTQIKDALSA